MDAPASAKKKEAVGHRDGREDEHQFREFQRLGKEEGKKGRRGGKKRERGKLCLPESPRWLVAQGKSETAKASLGRIRQEEEVEGELAGIEEAVEVGKVLGGTGLEGNEGLREGGQFTRAEAQMEKGAWKDLVSPVDFMLYRTMLGFGVQLLQQFSGINAVGFIPFTEGNK
ncbi:hypothetical protein NSK_006138 [Nannochloropsis salina CCMP1776]|uniref:Major facilitator superfamily (MFS) profile domain-containing protein n=1 Tax=Nannochloropsis salina CCMP1776 TaxID=1027361 RepID=A0A4D9CVE1_9STRA|nr:hypothetical protein NSK_006138 [Nannochloropsis salina CCMP1776]|eukprot:TFJ82554.1 hypothetical protein NSK_006138 [Nannochloropsis salina CCMP1776]